MLAELSLGFFLEMQNPDNVLIFQRENNQRKDQIHFPKAWAAEKLLGREQTLGKEAEEGAEEEGRRQEGGMVSWPPERREPFSCERKHSGEEKPVQR